jgi:hypothetical protein
VREGNVEEEALHYDHYERLDEERTVITGDNPVKDPASLSQSLMLLV